MRSVASKTFVVGRDRDRWAHDDRQRDAARHLRLPALGVHPLAAPHAHRRHRDPGGRGEARDARLARHELEVGRDLALGEHRDALAGAQRRPPPTRASRARPPTRGRRGSGGCARGRSGSTGDFHSSAIARKRTLRARALARARARRAGRGARCGCTRAAPGRGAAPGASRCGGCGRAGGWGTRSPGRARRPARLDQDSADRIGVPLERCAFKLWARS